MIARTSPPMRLRTVTVKDRMQQGYVYALVEPEGGNFDPDFRPELTPAEMLKLGVFGGKYLTDCRHEFPASWFKGAKLSAERSNPALNFFGVHASQPLSVWRAKGWIHPDDPRGWFQWYCRYYRGAAWRTTRARSVAGGLCVATSGRSSAPAKRATFSADHGSARRSYTGLTTAASSERKREVRISCAHAAGSHEVDAALDRPGGRRRIH